MGETKALGLCEVWIDEFKGKIERLSWCRAIKSKIVCVERSAARGLNHQQSRRGRQQYARLRKTTKGGFLYLVGAGGGGVPATNSQENGRCMEMEDKKTRVS
eukprot:TRINITY_DN507_c0_g1_i2.p2 TRINITY_DN507_c0_g1~~TRINITY_DN507_c0_g1_i2.p2  ORF type:complete len:102 (-),score=5.36 TRINITY_DN507_c0_g1_i2:277-582(-)